MSEESQEELMERVKNMSPEELQAFQKERCIFCHIIDGKVQSKKIFTDDTVTGLLDINPSNPGHVLLMPNEHFAIMPQVPDETLGHLAITSKKLAQISLQALGAKGTNILIQNGVAAGQKAQHFMVHLIPRKENDGLPFALEKKDISQSDYDMVKERLQKKVNEIFGITQQEAEIIEESTSPVNEAIAATHEEPTEEQVEETPVEQEPAEVEQDPAPIEEKEPEPQEEPEEELEEEKEKLVFITSAQAKRFHTKLCPFGMNIPEEKRIYLTEDDLLESGKKPCTCVTGKKIPLPTLEKKEEVAESAPEVDTYKGGVDDANKVIEDTNKDIDELLDAVEDNDDEENEQDADEDHDDDESDDENNEANEDNNTDDSDDDNQPKEPPKQEGANLDEISRLFG